MGLRMPLGLGSQNLDCSGEVGPLPNSINWMSTKASQDSELRETDSHVPVPGSSKLRELALKSVHTECSAVSGHRGAAEGEFAQSHASKIKSRRAAGPPVSKCLLQGARRPPPFTLAFSSFTVCAAESRAGLRQNIFQSSVLSWYQGHPHFYSMYESIS